MATKQFYATGDFRYGTRMLRAGDPVELTAPKARLYSALGKVTDKAPRAAKAPEPVEPLKAPTAPKPATKRATPRKRKAKAKKA